MAQKKQIGFISGEKWAKLSDNHSMMSQNKKGRKDKQSGHTLQ
jgi:hypothetical protein